MRDGYFVARPDEAPGFEIIGCAARQPAIFQSPDTIHAGDQPVPPPHVARPFPFRQPGRRERPPDGTEAEIHDAFGEGLALGTGHLAADLDMGQRLVRGDQSAHQVADPFVAGQIIEDATIGGVADARLFGAVAPMLNAMSRAKARKAAKMIDIDFACMAGHRFGEAECTRPAAAQHIIPKPQVGRQFAIGPGIAADIIAPDVPILVIRVHDVAMVPEAIPAAPVDLFGIEIDQIDQLILDPRLQRAGAVGQAPNAQHIGRVNAFGRHHQLRWRRIGLRHRRQMRRAGRCRAGPEGQFAGAGRAGRVIPAGLIILIGDVQPFILGGIGFHAHDVPVRAHVHRLCVGRPEPGSERRLVGVGATNVDLCGMPLPEIARRDRDAACGRSDIAKALRARSRCRIDPRLPGLGPLGDGKAVGGELAQREIAPSRDAAEQIADRRCHAIQRHGLARNLCLARGPTRIAAEAGQRPHRLAEQSVRAGADPHMTVVRGSIHRHLRLQAEAADEIPGRIAVEDETMHDAQMIGPCIGIKADDKRQPGAPLPLVHPFQFHDGAHRPLLFDRRLVDPAGEMAALPALRCVVHAGDQRQRSHDGPLACFGRLDDGLARRADRPLDRSDGDDDPVGGFAQQDRRGRRDGLALDDRHACRRGVSGCQRMGGPF